MTTATTQMDTAHAADAPHRLYAVQYYGPDGPLCNCDNKPQGCLHGMKDHPCQSQSSVNQWECGFTYPLNDGVSPNNPTTSVFNTGYPDCEIDIGFLNMNADMEGCIYTDYTQGYLWYRPPQISDQWLDDIAAGNQINPLLMPATPPNPPSPPPYPPGEAPTPPPAVPNRLGDTLTCFVGPLEGFWSDLTGSTSSGTSDIYVAKVMCLNSYHCTGITNNAPGIDVWTLVYSCKESPVGCQYARGTNGVSTVAEAYYRFDPDGSHGCWLDGPPATPPSPPSSPPPVPCANLLTDNACQVNYRYAGLCHTDEAVRDCQLTCGRCHDGCRNRDYLWSGYVEGTSVCSVAGAAQCTGDSGFQITADTTPANGWADGIDSKCTQNIGLACQDSCGCCSYIYQNAPPSPPPPPPVCEDTGNVNCPTAIATLGCDCGGVIAQDCYKSCDCCGELSPPSPPPPLDLAIALQAGNPQDQHIIRWNVNYVFQAYGSLIEINDWVCWQPTMASNYDPPSDTPIEYCGTCLGGAYGFRVRAGTAFAGEYLESHEFDTTIDLHGQDGTDTHTLELCLFKADQVPGPAPFPGAQATRYNSVKLHIIYDPPSTPPPPLAPPPPQVSYPAVPDNGECWDHFVQMDSDGFANQFTAGNINIKCRDIAGSTCHEPTSEHFGCYSVVGHYCQRSCGCTFFPLERYAPHPYFPAPLFP